ncbi:MAG: isochorismatase family protein [Longimicrobiales bacterium]|nr:isochorismatase family protein [Longimicrobiales bacterium]
MTKTLLHPLPLLLTGLLLGPLPVGGQATTTAATQAALEDLTPANTVLIYVDFNTGLDNVLTTVPGPQFRQNVGAYVDIGTVFGDVPIALLGEENEFYGPFFPELDRIRDRARHFHRTAPSGYTPEMATWLAEARRPNVVIGGISIDNCTLHTSLDLLRNGYRVYVLTDVSPTNNPKAYEAAFTRLVQAGAVPLTWVTLATDLVGDWDSPAGRRLMPAMAQYLAASTVGTPIDTTPDGHGIR